MKADLPRPTRAGPIRGDLFRWAREHSGLSMHDVCKQGGPSPGYQSEVESGKKDNVSPDILARWLPLLGVTEAFVRGVLPRFAECPSAYPGSIKGLAAAFQELRSSLLWGTMLSQAKLKAVLELLVSAEAMTPKVLAYVLDADVEDLEEYRLGPSLMQKDLVGAIAGLLGVSERELLATVSQEAVWKAYGPMMILAYEKGISSEELQRLIDQL